MKKQIKDYVVRSNERLSDSYSLLKLQPADGSAIIDTCAGQFVEVEVPDSKSTFLRRPISINFVDRERNELWLLVRVAGEGTRHLVALAEGRVLSLVLPLGKGFSIPADTVSKVLLAGGGVGVAPMLYLGSELKNVALKWLSCWGRAARAICSSLRSLRRLDVCMCRPTTARWASMD